MVMVTIRIPAALREFVDGQAELAVQAQTPGEALRRLTEDNPALQTHLYHPDGRLRPFVHVFVGNRDLRETGDELVLPNDAEMRIVPSIAGG